MVLEGAGPSVIIDGSTPVDLAWEPAPDIGPGVYRAPLDFFPFTVTANGQTLTTLDEKRTGSADTPAPKQGMPAILWKDAFVNGVGSTGWNGVKALAMYRQHEKELLVRFKDQLDPRNMTMTVAPREPVVDTNGQDFTVVRNLTLRNSAIGVLVQGSANSMVERCVIDPADYGIVLDHGARNAELRFNRISLSPYAGSDTWYRGSWDNWQAMKVGGFYDRVGIAIKNTQGGHDIHDNYIHDHWDGIDDVGNPPWEGTHPDANPDLKVHHNLIRHLNDDGMETMGPSVNGQWHDNIVIRARCAFRIKAPQQGPLYIYRNIFLDSKEDPAQLGTGRTVLPRCRGLGLPQHQHLRHGREQELPPSRHDADHAQLPLL